MRTRALYVLVSAVCLVSPILVSGCRQRQVESMDQPVHIGLDELELVDQAVLTGQEEIDFLRAKAERDLEAVLAIDSGHLGATQIRGILADLDWRERQLHWRIANGFEGPEAAYTPEEFWRQMIEDRETLRLSDEAVRAIQAHLQVLSKADTTIAAYGAVGGNSQQGRDLVPSRQPYMDSRFRP